MRHRLSLPVTALTCVALLFSACSDHSGPSADDEAAARAVVADYVDAVGDLEPAATCAALSPTGQDQVVAALKTGQDCEEAFAEIWAGGTPIDTKSEVKEDARIRSGGSEQNAVTTTLDGDAGVVYVTPGEKGLHFPVERVDDEWLISDGTGLLVGMLPPSAQ